MAPDSLSGLALLLRDAEALKKAVRGIDGAERIINDLVRHLTLLDRHCTNWSRDYASLARKLDAAEIAAANQGDFGR